MSNIEDQIAKLQSTYQSAADKDMLYAELLEKYKKAQLRIEELESELKNRVPNLPSKDDVEAMSGMLDLISRLDESTIEKLNRFGGNKQ